MFSMPHPLSVNQSSGSPVRLRDFRQIRVASRSTSLNSSPRSEGIAISSKSVTQSGPHISWRVTIIIRNEVKFFHRLALSAPLPRFPLLVVGRRKGSFGTSSVINMQRTDSGSNTCRPTDRPPRPWLSLGADAGCLPHSFLPSFSRIGATRARANPFQSLRHR